MLRFFKRLLRKPYNFLLHGIREQKLKGKFHSQKQSFILSLKREGVKNVWLLGNDFPCLHDALSFTPFDRHYVYHPAWAYRKLVDNIQPVKHVDISSTLHFCSMISATISTEFYDYWPANLQLSQLDCNKGDLTNLPFDSQSIYSISCLHTIEHIGLGRYGDTIDATGDVKAMKELQRVIAKGGSLLLVVPIGIQNKIYFNAHRVYTPERIVESFSELKLQEFFYIQSNPILHPVVTNASIHSLDSETYGCGCFWFKREVL